MTDRVPIDSYRVLRLMGALLGISIALGACTTDGDVTATVPEDYRLRHPIAVEEGKQSIVVFVGNGRGGLSPSQRADVMGLARSWVREGTGAIVADVPVGTPNARAAASAYQEIREVLAAGGVPARGISQHRYRPDDPQFFAAVRLSYPRIKAAAGPCGVWPADLGPSIADPDYFENKPHYNFGCAMQRNLAAMIDNPADLEQPRSESYAYTARRTVAFEKYRKGEATNTTYPEAEKAKLSDTGK
jgi:pilus assembly protein CpaD